MYKPTLKTEMSPKKLDAMVSFKEETAPNFQQQKIEIDDDV